MPISPIIIEGTNKIREEEVLEEAESGIEEEAEAEAILTAIVHLILGPCRPTNALCIWEKVTGRDCAQSTKKQEQELPQTRTPVGMPLCSFHLHCSHLVVKIEWLNHRVKYSDFVAWTEVWNQRLLTANEYGFQLCGWRSWKWLSSWRRNKKFLALVTVKTSTWWQLTCKPRMGPNLPKNYLKPILLLGTDVTYVATPIAIQPFWHSMPSDLAI